MTLIERLRIRNENGTLAEITEEDQAAAADAIEVLQEQIELLEGTLESRDRNIAALQAENERLKAESAALEASPFSEEAYEILQSENRKLRAERDAYQQAADKMAADHKVERDALAAKLVPLELFSDEYEDWIRHHAGGGDFDGFLKLRYTPEEEAGSDCTPNHNCNGRMVHLPIGEQCDKCGGQHD